MEPLDRPCWDRYFIDLAVQVSKRSPDPKKQVGCILVSEKNSVISQGYNGLPRKVDEHQFDWTDRSIIRKVIIHAEMNCLLYAPKLPQLDNSKCKLYCTLSPCMECLKMIKSYGVTEIIFKEEYKDYKNVLKMANIFDVKMTIYSSI
jgi:dCMP deaminase